MLQPFVILALVITLTFLSALLYISLGARGVRHARAFGVIIELWLVAALFVAMSVLADRLLGPVPRAGVENEITVRLAQLRAMPASQQALLIGGWVLTLALLAHFIITMRTLQQGTIFTGPPSEEPEDDAHA